jgi:hypothetical protein
MTQQSEAVLSRKLTSSDGHVHQFLIAPHCSRGWEVREEHDDKVVRRVCYTDWHRVELARTVIDLRVSSLRQTGWVES